MYKTKKGINAQVVAEISAYKQEPQWMRKFRLSSFKLFLKKRMPSWGPSLEDLDFNDIFYYLKPTKHVVGDWKKLPKSILDTYEKIGVPEMEKKFLSGVSAQYESDVVYKSVQKTLTEKGVIFVDMDTAVQKYPDLVKKYISSVVSPADNKFAALNSAVWSGGSFIYVPKNVHVDLPLQAYFRINAERLGQFERTLIVADEGSFLHYIEGCTAPIYSTRSLHSAVVEIIVKKGARLRYSTVQNWSTNVYNLVTKRARVEESGVMEWVDGNLGSAVTMKYPSMYLVGAHGRGEIYSVAYAGKGQVQDVGGKVYHLAPDTSSRIISKSICEHGGRASYRGIVRMKKGMKNVSSHVVCDALLLDEKSRSDTYPTMDISGNECRMEHEASVSRVNEEQLLYLMSRGIPREEAITLVINGFIEPIVKELPLEYAVELNRLIGYQIHGH